MKKFSRSSMRIARRGAILGLSVVVSLVVILSGCNFNNDNKAPSSSTISDATNPSENQPAGTGNTEGTASDVTTSTNTCTFSADGSEAELKYMYEDKGSGIYSDEFNEPKGRFADKDAYWIYYFKFADNVKTANAVFNIGSQFKILGSIDGKTWTTVFDSVGTPSHAAVNVYLTTLLKGHDTLYLKFTDRDPSNGFGASLETLSLTYSLENGSIAQPAGPASYSAGNRDTSYTNSISFEANGGAAEKKFLYEDKSNDVYQNEFRFADKDAYWIYYFKFSDTVKDAAMDLDIKAQYLISGSVDGKNWEALTTAPGLPDRSIVHVDLSSVLKGHDTLYLKFSDRDTADGFGPGLWKLTLSYNLTNGKKDNGPKGFGNSQVNPQSPVNPQSAVNTLSFAANGGSVETKYLYEDKSNGIFDNELRFADNTAYWIYYFKFSDNLATAGVDLDIKAQYLITASVDGKTWNPVASAKGLPERGMVHLDLTPLMKGQDALYLKFSDKNTDDGFGPGLWGLTLNYTLGNGQKDSGPAGPNGTKDSGPAGPIVTPEKPSQEINTYSFATNGGADEKKYIYEDKSNGVFNNELRFADNTAYWVYYFKFSDDLATASADLDIKAQYLVSASVDGKTWSPVAAAEGLPERRIVHLDLTSLMKGKDTLYLKFSDKSTGDGFGPGLWGLTLAYSLANGQKDSGPAGPEHSQPVINTSSNGTDDSGPSDPIIIPEEPSPEINTFSFATNGSADETKYLYEDVNSGVSDAEQLRFADNTAYWVYYFKFSDNLATASADLDIKAQYLISASVDGATWSPVATAEGLPGRSTVHLDLTSLMQGHDTLYLKFSDRDTNDGFGPGLWGLTLTYKLASGQEDSGPAGPVVTPEEPSAEINTLSFATNGSTDETKYLYEDKSNGVFDNTQRFADETAYWVYYFKFSDNLATASADLDIKAQYLISASVDGTTWSPVATAVGLPDRGIVHLDLTSLMQGQDTLYLKFSDKSTEDGFGPQLWGLALTYTLANGQADSGPTGPVVTPEEPSPEINTLSFATNGSADETKYLYEDYSNGVFDNALRFADETSYWVYYFKFSDSLATASADLDIKAQYLVSASVDGSTWSPVADAEGYPDRGTVHVDLTPLMQEQDTLYLKFSDKSTEDGFGPQLWGLTLTYTLASGQADSGPTGPVVTPEEPAPEINTFSLATDGSADETKYLYEDYSNGVFDNTLRFADETAYWVYCFKFSDNLDTASADLDIKAQYLVNASVDGSTWNPVATAGGYPDRGTVHVDLTSLMQGQDTLYLKFSDNSPEDGFGPQLWGLTLTYTLANGQADSGPAGPVVTPEEPSPVINTISFATDGSADETKYLYEDYSNGVFDNALRFADETAYWVYCFKFSDNLDTASADLDIKAQYLVSASVDGSTWNPVATAEEYPDRGIVHLDLTSLMQEQDTLYLKISDNSPEDGFGPQLWGLTLTYTLANGQADSGPAGPDSSESVSDTFGFIPNGNNKRTLYHASVE